MEALDSVDLTARVMSFPGGIDTSLGANNVELSAGETQKLLLARAALAHYDLLILDEALSSLDSATALMILRRLKDTFCRGNRGGVLLVTHRESEVALMDEYYTLENGELRSAETLKHPCGSSGGATQAEVAGE
ncbi:MAG: ATP-binding cassette domain-containing protein [bacterium]|nr:ATP-binding cassette domain-containing protein [bacterium]